jgi:formate dehydrogenase beta subunit
MAINRRCALKVLAGASATAAAATLPAQAREPRVAPADAVGMLYDTTRCIGCKACVVACHEANDLEPERDRFAGGIYDAPERLTSQTKNIIKLYHEGARRSYMKSQCMHCVDPACVGACMIGALQKREYGIVTWDSGRCIGCRYCQMVCPFNIPKFEWYATNPRIIKCEMCNHLLAKGEIPACCRVCPREAVIYGKRAELLEEAKRRLADNPRKYVPKIYGEHDAGGTQVIYLSHVPFDKLGLPDLGEEPVPEVQQTVQHGIYKGFVAPVVLYAALGAVLWRNRRGAGGQADEEVSHD